MKLAIALSTVALVMVGCAAPPRQIPDPDPPPALVPPPAKGQADQAAVQHYRCEDRTDFSVRFNEDTAVFDRGALGSDTLGRDAGGVTPQQSVYSNVRVRAEFGLGEGNRGAVLHYLAPAKDVRCSRD